MSLSPSDELKLTPEDISNLTNNNFILPTAKDSTKRQVSAAFLSSSAIPTSSSPSPTTTIRHVYSLPPRGFVKTPIPLDSPDTLEVCGYNAPTASTIYSKFLTKSAASTNTLLHYAFAHVVVLKHPDAADMSDQQLLDRVGFSDRMKRIFANPLHAQILQTESLHIWFVDTIRGNCRSVMNIQERVKETARECGQMEGFDGGERDV